MLDSAELRQLSRTSRNRVELWSRVLETAEARWVIEVGVWRGQFAEQVLRECGHIERYVLVDPWRHLEAWNKRRNVSDDAFARVMDEAVRRTAFAGSRVDVRRGTTAEVLPSTPGLYDAVYLDGDHTLRGITIDAVLAYAKVREGGLIGGDDFGQSIWVPGGLRREPTLVFPYMVHFAEAVGARIIALPFDQFLLQKPVGDERQFEFVDLTGKYSDLELRRQLLRVADPALARVRRVGRSAMRKARSEVRRRRHP